MFNRSQMSVENIGHLGKFLFKLPRQHHLLHPSLTKPLHPPTRYHHSSLSQSQHRLPSEQQHPSLPSLLCRHHTERTFTCAFPWCFHNELADISAFVYCRRRRKQYSTDEKILRSDTSLQFFPPNAESGNGGRKVRHTSLTSSKFLYLGTIVNSRVVEDRFGSRTNDASGAPSLSPHPTN